MTSFEVQVWGNPEDGFTAYLPHLDTQVSGETFDEAEREAVHLARALGPVSENRHDQSF